MLECIGHQTIQHGELSVLQVMSIESPTKSARTSVAEAPARIAQPKCSKVVEDMKGGDHGKKDRR